MTRVATWLIAVVYLAACAVTSAQEEEPDPTCTNWPAYVSGKRIPSSPDLDMPEATYKLSDSYFKPQCQSASYNWEVEEQVSSTLAQQVELFAYRQALYLSEGPKPDTKYLIWKCRPRSGLGNRLIGISSAYTMAILTGRTLVLDINDDVAEAHCDPIRSWTKSVMFRDPELLQQYESYVESSTVGSIEVSHRNSPFLINGRGERVRTHDMLQCRRIQWEYDSVKFLTLTTNQMFIPVLFENENYRKQLYQMFPDFDVLGPLLRYLFNPTDEIWTQIQDLALELEESDDNIGMHIRLFNADKHTEHLYHNVSSQFQECMQEYEGASYLDNVNHKLYLATLDKDLNREYGEKYPQQLVRAYPEGLKSECLGCPKDGRTFVDLVENYALSLVRTIYISPASTFGYTAFARARKHPVLVLPNMELTFRKGRKSYERAMQEQNCFRLNPSQVCFHSAWKELHDPTYCSPQSSSMRNARKHRYEQCADWKDGVYITAANMDL